MTWRLFSQGASSGTIRQFYYDGTAYYLLVFCAFGGAMAGSVISPTTRALVASRYYVAAKSMFCSRLILRLRSYFSSESAFVEGSLNKIPALSGDATSPDFRFAPANGFGDPGPSSGTAESGVKEVVTYLDVTSSGPVEEDWTNSPAPYLKPAPATTITVRGAAAAVDEYALTARSMDVEAVVPSSSIGLRQLFPTASPN
ncbi:hypothetical protein FRB99_001932 [Tulasnella sp. 403]|nr:hypothetical protein FRB99_001932 [Tulasnella sp. 403]